jgi:hypothetical protein
MFTRIHNRNKLVDRFLAEYPGPGGSESYFYSLDPPVETAVRATGGDGLDQPIVASADVGPDLIAPWRQPSLVILYVRRVIDPSTLGLVSSQGPHDANVIVRMPADQSVFPSPPLVAHVRGRDVLLADPLQQIWDLEALGGSGTPAEAAAVVRRLFGSRHSPAMRGLASQQHLSPEGADQRHTRILAPMARVLAA